MLYNEIDCSYPFSQREYLNPMSKAQWGYYMWDAGSYMWDAAWYLDHSLKGVLNLVDIADKFIFFIF